MFLTSRDKRFFCPIQLASPKQRKQNLNEKNFQNTKIKNFFF